MYERSLAARAEWHYKNNAIWDQVGLSSPGTCLPASGRLEDTSFQVAFVLPHSANKERTYGLK